MVGEKETSQGREITVVLNVVKRKDIVRWSSHIKVVEKISTTMSIKHKKEVVKISKFDILFYRTY